MNKILIIEGMHRSGTSLITQWLYKCGLHVGEHLLKPDLGNVEGHFEDIDFIKLHEEFFEALDLPTTGLFDKGACNISFYRKKKLKAIIDLKNNLSNQWGWKDPRTCLFLHIYRELVPEAFHLIITRNYAAVVNSLINREFKYLEFKYSKRKAFSRWLWKNFRRGPRKRKLKKLYAEPFLKQWIAYNEALLNHIEELPKDQYILVDYLYILQNDKQVFEHLKNHWDFDLTYFDFNKVFKQNLVGKVADIDAFIHDRSLIEKAKQLEAALNKHHFNNHEKAFQYFMQQKLAKA